MADSSGELGPWRLGLQKPKRSLWSLIFNPEGNLYLAYNSLLQQVESDIGELRPEAVSSFEATPSFKLLYNLVHFLIGKCEEVSSGTLFQFKIVRELQGEPALTPGEGILVSREFRY